MMNREAVDDWFEKCMTCKHVYKKIDDDETLYCRCRKGCRYEEAKIRRNIEQKSVMNNQEAIKILEVAKAECEWNAPLEYQVAFDIAIEALQKQIPKKPKRVGYFLVCPICYGRNGLFDDNYVVTKQIGHDENISHCLVCGQAIDWIEDKE